MRGCSRTRAVGLPPTLDDDPTSRVRLISIGGRWRRPCVTSRSPNPPQPTGSLSVSDIRDWWSLFSVQPPGEVINLSVGRSVFHSHCFHFFSISIYFSPLNGKTKLIIILILINKKCAIIFFLSTYKKILAWKIKRKND